MPRGKRSRALDGFYIHALEEFRADRHLSLPRLVVEMGAPFSWEVLQRALAGEPVWELNHRFIVRWIDTRQKAIEAERNADEFGAIGTPSKSTTGR